MRLTNSIWTAPQKQLAVALSLVDQPSPKGTPEVSLSEEAMFL